MQINIIFVFLSFWFEQAFLSFYLYSLAVVDRIDGFFYYNYK